MKSNPNSFQERVINSLQDYLKHTMPQKPEQDNRGLFQSNLPTQEYESENTQDSLGFGNSNKQVEKKKLRHSSPFCTNHCLTFLVIPRHQG